MQWGQLPCARLSHAPAAIAVASAVCSWLRSMRSRLDAICRYANAPACSCSPPSAAAAVQRSGGLAFQAGERDSRECGTVTSNSAADISCQHPQPSLRTARPWRTYWHTGGRVPRTAAANALAAQRATRQPLATPAALSLPQHNRSEP